MAKEKVPAPKKMISRPAQKSSITSFLKQAESFIEIITKIFELFTWRVVILLALIIFYSPVKQIVEIIPKKIDAANEITVGNFLILKIQEEAKASGNEELAAIITGLSKEAIEMILKIGDGPFRVIGSDDGRTGIVQNYYLSPYFETWIELFDRGLITSTVDLYEFKAYFDSLEPKDGMIPVSRLTAEQEGKLLNNTVKLSNTGKTAYDIIIKVITDSIGQ